MLLQRHLIYAQSVATLSLYLFFPLQQRLPLSKQMTDAPPKRMPPETDVWVLHIVCDCSQCGRVCVRLSSVHCLLGVKFMHFGWLTTTDNYNNVAWICWMVAQAFKTLIDWKLLLPGLLLLLLPKLVSDIAGGDETCAFNHQRDKKQRRRRRQIANKLQKLNQIRMQLQTNIASTRAPDWGTQSVLRTTHRQTCHEYSSSSARQLARQA